MGSFSSKFQASSKISMQLVQLKFNPMCLLFIWRLYFRYVLDIAAKINITSSDDSLQVEQAMEQRFAPVWANHVEESPI